MNTKTAVRKTVIKKKIPLHTIMAKMNGYHAILMISTEQANLVGMLGSILFGVTIRITHAEPRLMMDWTTAED